MSMRAFVCLIAACIATQVWALTDRYFPDLDVTSPDGRWRITAISPDNAGQEPVPFADEFTYTFFDNASGTAIWARQQPDSEMPPVKIFLSDEGHIVVRTCWDELIGLDPKSGAIAFKVPILDEFSKQERDLHVVHTTAGPLWYGSSRWSFHSFRDRRYFVLRTGWGRRVIVDLGSRRVEPSPDAELLLSLDRADSDFALAVLKRVCDPNVAPPPEKDRKKSYAYYQDLMAAIKISADLGVHDAVPMLEQLQARDEVAISTSHYDVYGLRRACHYALRVIGVQPNDLPLTKLDLSFDFDPPPQHAEETRAERATFAKIGLSDVEVFRLLGAPDHITMIRRDWEYDIDAPDPYTLRISWSEGKNVAEAIDRITPPKWKTGARARQIFEGAWAAD